MTGERARLFVALELPERAVTTLRSWGDTALGEVTGLRRTPPEALHVTLCFLGSQPVGEIEAIGAVCRTAARAGAAGAGPASGRAPDLRLGAPVWLPRRRPRVLAVELTDVSGSIADLQSVLALELERGGWYEPESRRFFPHVTVGRFGRAGGHVVELIAPPPLDFSGVSIALLRSRPGPGGSRYEHLASVALGPPA